MAGKSKKADRLLSKRPELASEAQGDRIGYARVSTDDQDLSVQIAALERAGCVNIYREKGSAVTGKRYQLALCKKDLQRGDTLVVWRLDRLGRSIKDIIEWLEWMDAEGIRFLSLNENFDTGTAGGRFLIHIFAAVAEFERQLTIERTKAKLQHLKDAGVRLGAAKKINPKMQRAIEHDLLHTKLTNREIAAKHKIGLSTVTYLFPGGRRELLAKRKAKKAKRRAL